MQTFLVSWHHVHCYISRLDIPADRLRMLEIGDRHCLRGLCVKRTNLFDMTVPEERIEIVKAIARIAIHGLRPYATYSKKHVLQRLQGSGRHGP